jgi:hypothetical protein
MRIARSRMVLDIFPRFGGATTPVLFRRRRACMRVRDVRRIRFLMLRFA